jgi:hypothetical protein
MDRRIGSAGMLGALAVAATLAQACTPTVKLQAPDKPIEINLNVKIDQEVRVRLDKEVEDLIANNPDAF